MIPAGVRIWAAATPVDMRRGLVGLAEATREQLAHDPGNGALYVFTNKRRDRLKLLWHDRTGFCLLYKVLDGRGFFRIPEAAPGATSLSIDAAEMAAILEGVQLPVARATPRKTAQQAREAALHAGSTVSN
ncbi:MAG TPA: IS66 family insertion sequence element accessory protein TnpB [Anaeromyxobacteraceae bacterium]|nr:IS66 family insertion sequence element accessory protein TnpB [Anaeromyxobacteraceae bacterium]